MCTYDAYTVPIPHNDEFSVSQASEESNPFMEVTDDHPGHVPSFCVRVCAICALECRKWCVCACPGHGIDQHTTSDRLSEFPELLRT